MKVESFFFFFYLSFILCMLLLAQVLHNCLKIYLQELYYFIYILQGRQTPHIKCIDIIIINYFLQWDYLFFPHIFGTFWPPATLWPFYTLLSLPNLTIEH